MNFRRSFVRWSIIAAAILMLAVLLLLLFAHGMIFGEPGDPQAVGVDTVLIRPGMTASSAAGLLASQGLIDSPRNLVWYLRLRGRINDLRAGTYILPKAASMAELVKILTEGSVARTSVTFPEGWTAERMARRLQARGVIDSVSFVEAVRSKELTAKFGYPELESLDGLLFPETYVFPLDQPAERIVREMVRTFERRVGQPWLAGARADELGLKGIIVLASIIEAEVKLLEESDDVAAVYRNRLKLGMKLDADPTIQFILPDGPRRLLHVDLELDSPYNTYKYAGLPPGPIGNPGEHALRAALVPAEEDWLYMVATGDGGHTFTTTYAQHLKEKAKFDEVRRRVAREGKVPGQ